MCGRCLSKGAGTANLCGRAGDVLYINGEPLLNYNTQNISLLATKTARLEPQVGQNAQNISVLATSVLALGNGIASLQGAVHSLLLRAEQGAVFGLSIVLSVWLAVTATDASH